MALAIAMLTSCSDNGSSTPNEPEDTFDASVVCPAEGMNAYGEPNRGTFTDARDGQVYKYTTIGNQVWMAENLKFDAPYSLCYDKIEGFCDTFGRFYNLHENGESIGMFDQDLLDTICPAGWHVPSVDEWNVLFANMGGEEKASQRLGSNIMFEEESSAGTDDCSFTSLPSGYYLMNGSVSSVNVVSQYWTSTAENISSSFCVSIVPGIVFWHNYHKMTIRCIRD